MDYTDLINAQSPDQVPAVLRKAADAYRESAMELASAWQDKQAGKVWDDIARILERAAGQVGTAIANRGL